VIYSGIEQEAARLNVPSDLWRFSDANEDYGLCSTYPRSICVPAKISDDQLRNVANFRSNGRLPALCWYNVVTGASIVRCAQPLVGLLRASCPDDIAFVDAVRLSNSHLNERQQNARSNSLIYLVDARPKISAYANQAKGAGTENPANYPNSRQVFLGIENIHAVRVSHKALFDLLLGQCLSGESSSGWYAGIEKTGWMEHIQSVVKGACKVVEMMSNKASVVIHCSDGWDRTSQISGLVQVLLDPYYRTLKGFAVLIEKEWLSFGHKFEDRHVQKKLGFWTEHESSPIFSQWLDCVYQVMMQFPRAFEFNEKFLLSILDNSYSLRYITFLGSCEKDRIKFRGMAGMWNVLLNDASMLNTDYKSCNSGLKVEWHTPAMMSIWKSLYLRFFVRHGSGPGSAFSHQEPDYERSDKKMNNENDGPTSWSDEAKNSRDDQICLSEEVDLQIFDDYETSAKMIPLRPKQETEEASFTTTVYNECQKIANNLFSQPAVLTN
jgi:myotubularin-related protein 1/2